MLLFIHNGEESCFSKKAEVKSRTQMSRYVLVGEDKVLFLAVTQFPVGFVYD